MEKKKIKKIIKKSGKKSTTKAKVVKVAKKIIKKIVSKKSPKKRIKKVVREKEQPVRLKRSEKNPIMNPSLYSWESQAVFNPAVVSSDGQVHLFYRALGEDGISRIGYARSKDGINFEERLLYPVYSMQSAEETKKHWPFTSPARPVYDNSLYSSGGGWGGCEDPRTVIIEGRLYMTLNIFNGWNSMRVAVISISETDLLKQKWNWSSLSYLSRPGDRQKNWVLFPEKINGKFAIFHNLDLGDPSRVGITYMNNLDHSEAPLGSAPESGAPDPQRLPDHIVAWHKRTRSASCPPIKTKDGWLLLYHAMDKDGSDKYKLGALLLDLEDPRKVLYRAKHPILSPDEWYENDYKPGVIYASGAVVKPASTQGGDDMLLVYYGGGDKYIGVAQIELSLLINSMKGNGVAKLEKKKAVSVSQ